MWPSPVTHTLRRGLVASGRAKTRNGPNVVPAGRDVHRRPPVRRSHPENGRGVGEQQLCESSMGARSARRGGARRGCVQRPGGTVRARAGSAEEDPQVRSESSKSPLAACGATTAGRPLAEIRARRRKLTPRRCEQHRPVVEAAESTEARRTDRARSRSRGRARHSGCGASRAERAASLRHEGAREVAPWTRRARAVADTQFTAANRARPPRSGRDESPRCPLRSRRARGRRRRQHDPARRNPHQAASNHA